MQDRDSSINPRSLPIAWGRDFSNFPHYALVSGKAGIPKAHNEELEPTRNSLLSLRIASLVYKSAALGL